MKVFRYWWDVPLNHPFVSAYSLVAVREIKETDIYFEQIVEAVKKTPCHWVMEEVTVQRSDIHPQVTDKEIEDHRTRMK